MAFSAGTAVLILGWGVVLFILWNLHRFAKAFSASTFWKAAAGLTLAAAALGAWLSVNHQRDAVAPPRVLLFPFIENSVAGNASTALGFACADQLTQILHAQRTPGFYPLQPAAIFAFADPDSLIFEDYAARFTHALDLPYLGFGEYHQKQGRVIVQFRLLKVSSREPVLQATWSGTDTTNLNGAVADFGEKLCTYFGLDPPNSPSAYAGSVPPSGQNAYYAAYLNLLLQHNEAALGQALALTRQDSTSPLFIALAARARLQQLRNQRTDEAAWKNSLATLLPKLEKAVRRDSLYVPLCVLLSECYLQLKKWNEAEVLLRRAQQLDPTLARIYVLLARLHPSRFRQFGFRNELELYQHALKLNPLEMDAMLGAVERELLENRRDLALDLLEKYRRLNPQHLPTLMALGRIYIEKGDMAQTLPLFETIVRLDPQNSAAFYDLGVAYYHQNDLDNAKRFFERTLQLGDYADAHMYLAQIYERRGDTTAAIPHLRERIRLSNGDDDVYAAAARQHLYGLLLRRGEIPAQLLPDTVRKQLD